MDMCITIRDLQFDTIIGILPNERIKKQRVNINAEIVYSYRDSIFLDYGEIAKFIEYCMNTRHYDLLEVALEDIAYQCFMKFKGINSIMLHIEKPDILPNCIAGIRGKFYSDDFGG